MPEIQGIPVTWKWSVPIPLLGGSLRQTGRTKNGHKLYLTLSRSDFSFSTSALVCSLPRKKNPHPFNAYKELTPADCSHDQRWERGATRRMDLRLSVGANLLRCCVPAVVTVLRRGGTSAGPAVPAASDCVRLTTARKAFFWPIMSKQWP